MFIACHPVLSTEARVALTLRLLGGLTTDEIARAFLVPEPTIAQRIVRAKRTLAEERVPFEVPRGAELAARLASVLEVIYLIFNEGYTATAGDDWMRPALCEDALRLGRMLAELAPDGARSARARGADGDSGVAAARAVGPTGEPILLLDQNRARWDQLLIRRGLAALERAEALGGARGPYALQAAIAACHARARTAEETDWARIVALYDELATLDAVAGRRAQSRRRRRDGVRARRRARDLSTRSPTSRRSRAITCCRGVRGDLLAKLGRFDEARAEFVGPWVHRSTVHGSIACVDGPMARWPMAPWTHGPMDPWTYLMGHTSSRYRSEFRSIVGTSDPGVGGPMRRDREPGAPTTTREWPTFTPSP